MDTIEWGIPSETAPQVALLILKLVTYLLVTVV